MSEAYVCNGHVFKSTNDVKSFLGPELATVKVSLASDTFGMVSNCEKGNIGEKDWAEKHANANKAGYTPQDIKVLWSRVAEAPPCLYAKSPGKSEAVPIDEGFGDMFKTFDKFSGTGKHSVSAKATIKTRLGQLKTSQDKLIMHSCKAGSKARGLFLHMTERSKECGNIWLDYCGTKCETLVQRSGYTVADAWNTVGVCSRHLWESVAPPRIGVSELDDIDDEDIKAEIFWALMSSQAILERVVKADFDSDPIMVASMSYFLMTNRVDKAAFTESTDKLAKMIKKVEGLEGDVKPLKSTVTEHTKQISGLQRSKQDKK